MLDEKAWLRRYTLALSAERPVFDDEEGPARALSQSVAPASSDVPMRPVTVGSFNLPDADSSPSSGSTSFHSVDYPALRRRNRTDSVRPIVEGWRSGQIHADDIAGTDDTAAGAWGFWEEEEHHLEDEDRMLTETYGSIMQGWEDVSKAEENSVMPHSSAKYTAFNLSFGALRCAVVKIILVACEACTAISLVHQLMMMLTADESAAEKVDRCNCSWWPPDWKELGRKTRYYIPILGWLPQYPWKRDIGVTLAVMVIPQGLGMSLPLAKRRFMLTNGAAYSSLAQVDPIVGLYTALTPMVIYFILGTSRQLAIGPEGVVSLLTGGAISFGSSGQSSREMEDRATTLAFLVGVVTFVMGIARVGFLDSLISHPILHGFVSASASIIIIEQLDTFLGIPNITEHEWEKLIAVFENIAKTSWGTAFFGTTCIALIIAFDFLKGALSKKKYLEWTRLFPTTLAVVVISIFVTWLADLEDAGIAIMGDVKGGFPVPRVPKFYDFSYIQEMFVPAVLITVVGFVESTAIAKKYANAHNYPVSANRELVAFGISNLISSFMQSYPAFGSLPRSEVADAAGQITQLAAFLGAMLVLLCILFLMPLFFYLPMTAVAAIVIVAAGRLIHFDFKFQWQIRAYREMFLSIVSFLSTFFLGPELGIVVALGVSLFLVVKHTTMPSLSILGKSPSGKWQDISMFESARPIPGVLVIRIEESLYFGNIEQIKDMISRIERLGDPHMHPSAQPLDLIPVHGVVLDFRHIHTMDSIALTEILSMAEDYRRRNVNMFLVDVRLEQLSTFAAAGLFSVLEEDRVHSRLSNAVEHAQTLHAMDAPVTRMDTGYQQSIRTSIDNYVKVMSRPQGQVEDDDDDDEGITERAERLLAAVDAEEDEERKEKAGGGESGDDGGDDGGDDEGNDGADGDGDGGTPGVSGGNGASGDADGIFYTV